MSTTTTSSKTERNQVIVAMLEDGMNPEEIAEALQITVAVVYSGAKLEGYKFGPRGRPSDPMSRRNLQITEALTTMRTYQEIANEFGVSRQRIAQIAKLTNHTRSVSLNQEERESVLAAYVDKANTSHCVSCGRVAGALEHHRGFCSDCSAAIRLIINLKTILRCYKNAKPNEMREQHAKNALSIIRRNNLDPQDLDLA
jgi:hypothetical protein